MWRRRSCDRTPRGAFEQRRRGKVAQQREVGVKARRPGAVRTGVGERKRQVSRGGWSPGSTGAIGDSWDSRPRGSRDGCATLRRAFRPYHTLTPTFSTSPRSMSRAMATFSLEDQPEVFFTSTETSRSIRRLLDAGRLRHVGGRLYTRNLDDPFEEVLRRRVWDVAAGHFPGAVIVDRSRRPA